MKTYTLGFLFKGNKIILAKKKRKIGVDKYNGYGGRVEGDEDKINSLIREIGEECEVVVEREDCRELGVVDFIFEDDGMHLKVYIYRIDKFQGIPKETEEMGEPREFDPVEEKMPYEEMLTGDDEFIPFVLENKKFSGELHFSEKEKKVSKCTIREIKSENSNEIRIK